MIGQLLQSFSKSEALAQRYAPDASRSKQILHCLTRVSGITYSPSIIYWRLALHIFYVVYSYILKVPFDKEDRSGIVYVWVGSKADPEEARIAEEIAREMYDGVRKKNSLNFFDNICLSKIAISFPLSQLLVFMTLIFVCILRKEFCD